MSSFLDPPIHQYQFEPYNALEAVMKKAGDILADLGFRADAPEGAQKAFIKNLVRSAYGAEVRDINEARKSTPNPEPKLKAKLASGSSEQLSFDFEDKSNQ